MQPVRSSPRTEAGRILDHDGAAESHAQILDNHVSEVSGFRHGFHRASWYLHRSHVTPYERRGTPRAGVRPAEQPAQPLRVTSESSAVMRHRSPRQSGFGASARPTALPLADIILPPDRRMALCTDHLGRPILYSGAFSSWLNRMAQTRDYLTESTRPAVMASLAELVSLLAAQDDPLRERCFMLANEALASCNDNVADALNDMHILVFDAAFNPADKTEEEIFTLGRRCFALDLVDRHTVNYLGACRRAGRPHREEIEVKLAFRLALKSRFQLPVQSQSMLYAPSANLTKEDCDTACKEVQSGMDDDSQLAAFIRQWSPLKRYVQHRFAPEIAQTHERFVRRGELLEKRSEKGELSEQAYLDAYAALSSERVLACQSLVDQKSEELIAGRLKTIAEQKNRIRT